ncbi:hypothetical protein AURDEDRAFT_172347 [Auricularia subglabra TFB-10046 SS5]|nr:hypothetical protein AURDEDRAFT_172347 [Auricularia subglabra TFB-10046 SS5]
MDVREQAYASISRNVAEAEQDNVDLDEDGAPLPGDEADATNGPHARGPLSDAQKNRIHELTEKFLASMTDIARRPETSLLTEARLALKLTRKPRFDASDRTQGQVNPRMAGNHAPQHETGLAVSAPETPEPGPRQGEESQLLDSGM